MQATKKSIMETLPTRRQAYIGAATAKVLKTHFFCFIFLLKVLSHYSEDEVYLPETPSWLFGEERVRGIFFFFFTFFSLLIVLIVYGV